MGTYRLNFGSWIVATLMVALLALLTGGAKLSAESDVISVYFLNLTEAEARAIEATEDFARFDLSRKHKWLHQYDVVFYIIRESDPRIPEYSAGLVIPGEKIRDVASGRESMVELRLFDKENTQTLIYLVSRTFMNSIELDCRVNAIIKAWGAITIEPFSRHVDC